jgi:hypothetical protein
LFTERFLSIAIQDSVLGSALQGGLIYQAELCMTFVRFRMKMQILNRARKSALYKDPHLRSSPFQGEGKNGTDREDG